MTTPQTGVFTNNIFKTYLNMKIRLLSLLLIAALTVSCTDRNDIINVGKIVGLLRTTFGSQYAEIEALREKKERQIESLISEIAKASARTDLLLQKLLEKQP